LPPKALRCRQGNPTTRKPPNAHRTLPPAVSTPYRGRAFRYDIWRPEYGKIPGGYECHGNLSLPRDKALTGATPRLRCFRIPGERWVLLLNNGITKQMPTGFGGQEWYDGGEPGGSQKASPSTMAADNILGTLRMDSKPPVRITATAKMRPQSAGQRIHHPAGTETARLVGGE